MSYTCCQKIIVIEDPQTCNQAFEEYILLPALQFIGLDCEWNTNRPVSLLQVATPTVVLLVRVCHLNFILPSNVKLVLEDPTIYKVGVNIENDSEKLGDDCFCKIKSWVDLRHVAIRSVCWGSCIVDQVNNLEYNLRFYDQADPKSESAKTASGKRLSWCPKMGLESLISDCLDQNLPKNTSARWSDDWEIKHLQPNQQTYAANDATAALDIFIALVYTSVMGESLPLPLNFDAAEIVGKYAQHLEDAVKGLLDVPFMQTKEDMTKIYKLIEATEPHLNIKGYYTKPPPSKSKQEKKEIYKKKAKEALAANSLPAPNSSATQHTTSESLLPETETTEQSLDTSKSSFTFKEITDALQHTKPNSKTLAEDYLNMQSDREESYSRDDIEYSAFQILFYFKHTTNKKAPLIPGFSYGRGSKPPNGYRRFRSVESQTQTDFDFDETNFKKVDPSNKSIDVNESERSTLSNTDYSCVFLPLPRNIVLVAPQSRTESPLPRSTTDDDGGSESSCTSSNYHSSVSKQSKSKGRGRGRGKAAPPSIGSTKNDDSGSDVRKGRGRGRGAVMSEIRASKTGSNTDSDNEKILYTSYDIRYQDAQEHPASPSAVELADRSRRQTTSSVSSVTTLRQQSAVSEHAPDITTPTNSFANPQPQSNFEDHFFETASNYSTFSIQDLMRPSPPARAASFNSRGYSAQNQRGSYNNVPKGHPRSDSSRTNNPYKATNRGHINDEYEYKTDIFRQAIVGGLHTGSTLGFAQPRKEEIANFDWGKFREDTGIGASEDDDKETSRHTVDLSCSESSSEEGGK